MIYVTTLYKVLKFKKNKFIANNRMQSRDLKCGYMANVRKVIKLGHVVWHKTKLSNGHR